MTLWEGGVGGGEGELNGVGEWHLVGVDRAGGRGGYLGVTRYCLRSI